MAGGFTEYINRDHLWFRYVYNTCNEFFHILSGKHSLKITTCLLFLFVFHWFFVFLSYIVFLAFNFVTLSCLNPDHNDFGVTFF